MADTTLYVICCGCKRSLAITIRVIDGQMIPITPGCECGSTEYTTHIKVANPRMITTVHGISE